MTPEQALQIINTFREQASGPFTGKDHDLVSRAVQVLAQAIKPALPNPAAVPAASLAPVIPMPPPVAPATPTPEKS